MSLKCRNPIVMMQLIYDQPQAGIGRKLPGERSSIGDEPSGSGQRTVRLLVRGLRTSFEMAQSHQRAGIGGLWP
jgi:hypothetical protein